MKLLFTLAQLPRGNGGVKYEAQYDGADKPVTIYIPQIAFIEEGIPVRLAPRHIHASLEFKVDETVLMEFVK